MDEPALYNHTGFRATVVPVLDRDGAQSRVVIVKASYAIRVGERLMPAEEPRDVRLGDEPWGVPEIPDIRLPGDFCAAKPGTDFVVSGHAIPSRDQRSRAFTDVTIRVAERTKVLRVHGPREWRRGIVAIIPSPSAPLGATPLAWSLAYGGLDLTDPARPLEEPRNPVGRGLARDIDRLVGQLAPQIEDPAVPIRAAGTPQAPMGCAPIGRHFAPRRKTMGTYDKAWLESTYPARPADYREEHENCAPPDFVFRDPLRGGEPVTVVGVHGAGALTFELPKFRILVEATIDGKTIERRPHLDTVVVDADAMILELVWRALYRCPARMHDRFTAIRVQAKEFLT
jgi:hypothetical protein